MVVATWNLENLFRPGSDEGPGEEQAYEAKLTELARVIGGIEPHVLAVQEVGDPEALEDLCAPRRRLAGRDLRVPGPARHRGGLSLAARARGGRPGTRVPRPLGARAGRRPGRHGGADEPRRAAGAGERAGPCRRPRQLSSEVEAADLPGGRFHPSDEGERARFGAYALYRRTAEAVTVRRYADELLDGEGRDRAVVVLGDLNDEPPAAITQILLGPPGSEIGTPGFDSDDQGDAWRLWNVAPLIPPSAASAAAFAAVAS